MIQIKILKDFNGMLKNHIYSLSEADALKLVEHGCPRDSNGDLRLGAGDIAVYYSEGRDELHNTLAPLMNIPTQLHSEILLRVSDGKKPIESSWPDTTNTVENKSFTEWIIDHEKYGVLCGGKNNLCVIDFDDPIIQQAVLDDNILPKTFSVRTAKKRLLHLYYYIPDGEGQIKSGPIKNEEKRTLLDIQYKRRQVIGPGSRITTGQTYDVIDDIPITSIPAALLHKALDRYNHTHTEEVLQTVADGLTLDDFRPKILNDNSLRDIKHQLKVSEVLRDAGIPVKGSRGNTRCPFHSSVGGKCLAYDDNKDGGLWKCFNCDDGGDVFTLWMKVNHVEDFAEAKKQLCEKLGIKDTFIIEKKIAAATPINTLPMVKLPCKNYTVAEFAVDVSQYFKGSETVFFKPDEKIVVEISDYEDKLSKKRIVGFAAVDPKRLLNLIEERANTFNIEYVKKEEVMVRQSPNEQTIKLLSANTNFLNALFKIRRFLNYPIPFLSSTGELIIPRHQPNKGYYDDRFQAYFTPDTPELRLMSIDEAKFLLNDILSEFCFRDELDNVMSLAYIITPMCRGLYSKPTTRTPVFIIQASRERSGKDYLAGIRGILYEGQAIDDNPIVTAEKNESNNEELRKKLTSALKIGRRLYHSSNNRGFLNNAVFEQFTTSEVWRDRELGRNTQLELNNEMDVSLSANLGLTFTPDLNHRSRFINLFFSQENPNERKFKRVDLHGYVSTNRSTILSAVYTLISAWVAAGRPPGKTPFTSFPEWARVVGGIMSYHNLGDPCTSIEDTNLGGDKETQSMKEFSGFMGLFQLNDAEQPKGYTIGRLRTIVTEAQSREDIEGFSHWDLNERPDQVKFGNLIKRFVGREFHCKQQVKFKDKDGVDAWTKFKVTLIIAKDNDKSNRILYGFPTEVENNTILKQEQLELPQAIKEESVEELMPKLSFDNAKEMLRSIFAASANGEVYKGTLVSRGISEEQIIDFINKGEIYDSRPGYVRLL